ncbi:hypothetical protein [Nonomuraea typhae]|uniref:Secreted protein n=1 Tax=Nonomuraea typhae TaxID=2603600 RepID=A0ABW7YQC5_9ACTN
MRRLSIAVAAAVAIAAGAPAPALADPPERAYVCETGGISFNPWNGSRSLLGLRCTGPEGTGPATVSLMSMHPWPATFTCQSAAMHQGTVIAGFC